MRQAFPTLAVITGVGIVIGVAYTLRAMQKAFWGSGNKEPELHDERNMKARRFPFRNAWCGLVDRRIADRRTLSTTALDVIIPEFQFAVV